jgi:hypothetical protein
MATIFMWMRKAYIIVCVNYSFTPPLTETDGYLDLKEEKTLSNP